MTREQALELLHQYVRTPNLIKHMLATEALMKGLARKFGEPENKWGLAGLLHDIDYEETKDKPEEHSLKGYKLLSKLGVDPEICQAIKVHNHLHGFIPETLMAKALFTSEALTGFLVACALVMPDKKLASVNLDSALKKFKTKSFAASADRGIIMQCEPLLGIKLEELMEICLREMQGIAEELEL